MADSLQEKRDLLGHSPLVHATLFIGPEPGKNDMS